MIVSKIFVYGFALALVVITPLLALTQDPSSDDEVRGAFLKSRQKPAATRRRPPSNPAPGGGKATPAHPKKPAESSEPALLRTTAPAPPEAPLALGYTLYQRGPDGEPTRVNPDQVFHSGAALRLTIEPNFDGYLYIFHTADDGPAKKLRLRRLLFQAPAGNWGGRRGAAGDIAGCDCADRAAGQQGRASGGRRPRNFAHRHPRLLPHLPPRWMLHPQPIGLDGEEIETGCELKGLPLRRTYG
jgi:hypothetical protein